MDERDRDVEIFNLRMQLEQSRGSRDWWLFALSILLAATIALLFVHDHPHGIADPASDEPDTQQQSDR